MPLQLFNEAYRRGEKLSEDALRHAPAIEPIQNFTRALFSPLALGRER